MHASAIPAAAGLGLRFAHHAVVHETRPRVPWFEVHPENYLDDAGACRELEDIRRDYPLSLHGVGLSLGSAGGISERHVLRLRQLAERFEPALMSEHLSWSRAGDVFLPDLLPLPYTEEALAVVCRNILHTQELLGRRLLIENPSTYLQFATSTIPEAQFLAEVSRRTECGVLLDVNNIHVSAGNQGLDATASLYRYLHSLPNASVAEIHLAGHAVKKLPDGRSLRIDDHGSPVCAEVWALYETAIATLGATPTLIEWDTCIPSFEALALEAATAQRVIDFHSTGMSLHAVAG